MEIYGKVNPFFELSVNEKIRMDNFMFNWAFWNSDCSYKWKSFKVKCFDMNYLFWRVIFTFFMGLMEMILDIWPASLESKIIALDEGEEREN